MKATRVCAIQDCEKPAKARGWCPMHYYRWKRQGSAEYQAPQRLCSVEDCARRHYGNDLCVMHHARWKKHGDPLALVNHARSGICELPDCGKPSPSQRYCPMHLERLKRNGHFGTQDRTRHLHQMGYVKVKAAGHVLADSKGWAYQHRLVLFEKIGPGAHDCFWCGMTVSWDRSYPLHRDGLVVDHLDDDRGNNDPANLVPSCSVCNFKRSDPLGKRWGKRVSA